jgi:hypothetical protein
MFESCLWIQVTSNQEIMGRNSDKIFDWRSRFFRRSRGSFPACSVDFDIKKARPANSLPNG